MKRTLLVALSSITLLTGCVAYPVSTPDGYVYQAEIIPPTVSIVPYYGYMTGYWPGYYGSHHHRRYNSYERYEHYRYYKHRR